MDWTYGSMYSVPVQIRLCIAESWLAVLVLYLRTMRWLEVSLLFRKGSVFIVLKNQGSESVSLRAGPCMMIS